MNVFSHAPLEGLISVTESPAWFVTHRCPPPRASPEGASNSLAPVTCGVLASAGAIHTPEAPISTNAKAHRELRFRETRCIEEIVGSAPRTNTSSCLSPIFPLLPCRYSPTRRVASSERRRLSKECLGRRDWSDSTRSRQCRGRSHPQGSSDRKWLPHTALPELAVSAFRPSSR